MITFYMHVVGGYYVEEKPLYPKCESENVEQNRKEEKVMCKCKECGWVWK